MEALIKHVQNGQAKAVKQYGLNHPLIQAYQNCFYKLKKWYERSDDAQTIYAAATLFSPVARKVYFDKQWEIEWIPPMLTKVYDYYKKHYYFEEMVKDTELLPPDPIEIQLGLSATQEGDPYYQYIEGPQLQRKTDVLSWWAITGPHQLRQMAFDLLSIPAMSAEVERMFSAAKHLLTTSRNRIGDDQFETYALLHNWWRDDNMPDVEEDSSDEDTLT